MSHTYGKDEKLKSRKLIAQLFSEGHTVTRFPIKVFYLSLEAGEKNLAAFAVPKKNFKSAVIRNRLKRQLRECYRLQKENTPSQNGKKFVLLFLYIGKDKPQYAKLTSSMAALLKKVMV